jgi:hypothetical protein
MTHPEWPDSLRVGRFCAASMSLQGRVARLVVEGNVGSRLRAITAGLQRARRVSAVDLVKIRQLGERSLDGEHISAGVFWLLIIVLAFYALW